MASNASIGKAIDEIAKLQKQRDALEAKVTAADKAITEKKDKLLARIQKSKLDGARGALGVASVVAEDLPQIEDFEKLCKFVAKTKGWDLFQRRMSKSAWLERVAEGKTVPGVTTFHRVTLRVTAIKGRRK